jgi:DNA repair protein SbcC/Rad50
MIPIELRVRNFMCYRDVPPLVFDGIHLACLTGPNGHGKSALLDAMTWALWGRARARRDDDLIHLGESEMEVEFTFDLGSTVYRVLRKRDSSGRGRTLLDLQVRSASGTFSSIAEPGVRATQDALVRLLRMDYDTFTNSAFLLQGRADAFTMRTPAERKGILGEILGLGLYDEYEQQAKERIRGKEREMAEVEGLLRDIDRELDRRPQYEAELATAEARVGQLSAALKLADAELNALRQEKQALEHQQARLRDLERRLAQSRREVSQVEGQMAERRERVAQYEEILSRRAEVEDGYARLLDARREEAAWNEGLAQDARLQGRQGELQRLVDAARHELELAAGRLSERIRELERRAADAPRHEEALAQVTGALELLARDQEERDAANARLQALNAESAGLQVRNEQLRAEMDALRKKLDVLQAETGTATCPVCGQDLAEEHRLRLASEMEEEGLALREMYKANNSRGREIDAGLEGLKAEIQQLDRRLSGLAAHQRRGAQLEQALEAARQAALDLEPLHAEREGLNARLEAAGYAAAEQAELGRLADERRKLGYDGRAHEEARARVASLLDFEAARQRLQSAVERVTDERGALADLQAWLRDKEASLAEDEAQRQSLAAEVSRLPAVARRAQAKALDVEDLHAQSSQARLVLGGAQQRLDHCALLAAERERRITDRQRLAEEKAVFEDLRLAFGKRGIQAMIIEAAIPEIEYEANRLLARMTDGRMHVRIETQRETLKGDTVETLDINIADELGTRPYELFSGGEAFRVNFAIRIALSKLLAHRAGAQLQMLVIDEGFGTQDAEGRSRLVEAITSIQDDFSRILVITHIEELKDAFPVRIEVTKSDDGSHFSLN